MDSKSCRLLILLFSLLMYGIIGVFIFRAVEGNNGAENSENDDEGLLARIKEDTTKTFNMTDAQFDSLVQEIQTATAGSSSGPDWSYKNSVSFVIQLLTTIGYGNITPITSAGRILCIFYAFFGIPLNILVLQLVGEKMLLGQQILVTKLETRVLKRDEPIEHLNEKCFLLGFSWLLLLLFTGAALHTKLDNWTFLEGFYCFFITFTTVGFGDLIPGSDGSARHVASRMIFIVLGLVAMANVLNALAGSSVAVKLFRRLCGPRQESRIAETEEDVGTELKHETK